MGMAASQARLLSITARIHDVEYMAQSIQNAKLQLATQEDQVYSDFLAAQDATTLTFRTMNSAGETQLMTATFNNMCSKNRLRSADGNMYNLRDNKGRLIVEDEVVHVYDDFTDAYAFAMYMVGADIRNTVGEPDSNQGNEFQQKTLSNEEEFYQLHQDDAGFESIKGMHQKLEEMVGGGDIYNESNLVDGVEIKDYREQLSAYKKALYNKSGLDLYLKLGDGSAVVDNATDSAEQAKLFNTEDFQYYVMLFEQIQSGPGCVAISDFNGPHGDAANNSDWLQAMIQSGQFYVEAVKMNNRTGEYSVSTTSPSSDISLGYTETTQIDKTAYAKAEAKYEHDMKQIDRKDKAYDLELSKLDTQRQALTTEYESVKKVISDNIERTFGIFS